MKTVMRIIGLVMVSLLALTTVAQARPEYARKEGKPCQYCHVSGSPGLTDPRTGDKQPTTRNERGRFYQTHDHTFTGYVEKSVPTPGNTSGKLSFKYQWKEEFSDKPCRIAVADVTGDGTPRLITLCQKGESKTASILLIRKWDGKQFNIEFTGESEGPADKLQVGQFAGAGSVAVLVTADALWLWNGKTYVRKPATKPLGLLGSVRMKSGEERLLVADAPMSVRAWKVRLDVASGWLTDSIEVPSSAQTTGMDMHASPQFFNDMGLGAMDGGLVGLWDVRRNGKSLLYNVNVEKSVDVKEGGKRPEFITKGNIYNLAFRDPRQASGEELWTTSRFAGIIYDVALESPRADGKPGFLILIGDTEKIKTRTLAFFALE